MPSKAWLFRKIFSDTENQIIEIIKKHKKVSIAKITTEYYKKRSDKPYNAGNWIAFLVRQIAGKCKHNGLTWTIEGEGTGRHGRTVWIKKR